MSTEDLEQFRQKDSTPESGPAQGKSKNAEPGIEGLAQNFKELASKWMELKKKPESPSKGEMYFSGHNGMGLDEPDLMAVLAGGAEYAKRLTEALLATGAFFEAPIVKKYGAGLLDVLKDKGVSSQLLPYVIQQLDTSRYSANTLAELTDANYLPQRKQSILDLAIARAKKEADKGMDLVPVLARLALPSSSLLRDLNSPILTKKFQAGKETGLIYIYQKDGADKPEKATDAPVALLDLFYSEFKKHKQSVIYLSVSDIEKATKIELRNQKGTKDKLSAFAARLQFITKLRERCARLYGFIKGDRKAYSVLEYRATDINSDCIGLSSELYSKVLELQENTKDYSLKLHNYLVTAEAGGTLNKYCYEILKQFTILVLERGNTPDCKKGIRADLTAGDPEAVTTCPSWQTLVDRCRQVKFRLEELPPADRNKFLKRCYGVVFGGIKTAGGKVKKPALFNRNYCLIEDYFKDVRLVAPDCPTYSVLGTTKILLVHRGPIPKTDKEKN